MPLDNWITYEKLTGYTNITYNSSSKNVLKYGWYQVKHSDQLIYKTIHFD